MNERELLVFAHDPGGHGTLILHDACLQGIAQLAAQLLSELHQKRFIDEVIHLASYVLWRLNWIHPFVDGNGRTARVVSFVVLCVKLGYRVPGSNTVPEQISHDKEPYYGALEQADTAYEKNQEIDVTAMEVLVDKLLVTQLAAVIRDARAGQPRQVE
jgi:Fic family protein